MKSRGRILLVEDEPLVGALLGAEIERLGFELAGHATDVDAARALAHGTRPDAAVIDFDLRGGGSSESLAAELQDGLGVPVVLVSGRAGEPGFAGAAASLAPIASLAKPIDPAALAEALEQALLKREQSGGPAGQLREGLITADLAGHVRSINNAAARLAGIEPGEAIGCALDDLLDLRDESGRPCPLMQCARRADRELTLGRLFLHAPGAASLAVAVKLAALRAPAGGLAGVVAVLLPESRAVAAGPAAWLAGQESVAAVVLGPDEALAYANPPATRLLGFAGESGGRDWGALLAAAGWQLDGSVATGPGAALLSLRRADGAVLAAQVLPLDGGHLVLVRDASAEEEHRRRRERAQRLEDLGYLARGYAHELNNRLTTIVAALARIEQEQEAGTTGTWGDALADARRAAAESAGFVRQIQVFSRGGRPLRRPFEPARWLRDLWPKLPRREGVHYHLDAPGPLPLLLADPGQLAKALENLFENANHAVAGHPHPQVTLSARALARQVRLAVSDNGPGMPPELAARAAEPYFTTRAAENATGIGLTVCEAIAKAHGGRLTIATRPGEGTVVALQLPVAETPAAPPAAPAPPMPLAPASSATPATPGAGAGAHEPPAVQAAAGDGLRILLLEDEAMVRRAMAFTLRREGWEVVETARGEDTIAEFRAARDNGRPFGLVVSDLTIRGGMGGVETLQHLRELDPDVRAIACSGYTDDPVISGPADFGFAAALPKPFDPSELATLVRRACLLVPDA
jgi:two-component system, cell cycle sensor histidine kinase and response regulator CckA